MRAPTLLWPRMISLSLLVCPVLLVDISPAAGADYPPAPNHIYPPGVRQGQSRPYTAPTGIFSSALGEGNGGAAKRASGRASMPVAGNRSAAAERTKGMIPQFMSLFNSKVPQPKPTARRPMNTTPGQANYRTASAAQSYSYPRQPAPGTATNRNPPVRMNAARLSRPDVDGRPRPAMKPAPRGSLPPAGTRRGGSAAAAALIQAHQSAGSARTEADFSQVFLACREIAIGQATAEEVAFAKHLASWALNRRGQMQAAAGRTKVALADFDTAVGLDPQCWRAIHNRGVLLAQAGQFERAFDDFNRATQLNPKFAKAFSNRAALYTLAGDPEAALADYQRAVNLDPKLAVAQRGLGRSYHMLGMMGEALEHYDTAVELTPNDAAALTSRGDLLTDLGHYADAADDYERALERNADSVDACRSSAWLLATCPDDAIRDPNLAVQRAQLAVRRERKADAENYDVLAAAQASTGDYRQAVRSIQQAIDLAPAAERGMYEDRLAMYQESQPLRIAPVGAVEQAHYKR